MVITEKTAVQAVRKSMGNSSGGCAQSAVPDLEDFKLVAGIEAGVKDTRRVQTEVESTGLRDALLAESAGFLRAVINAIRPGAVHKVFEPTSASAWTPCVPWEEREARQDQG